MKIILPEARNNKYGKFIPRGFVCSFTQATDADELLIVENFAGDRRTFYFSPGQHCFITEQSGNWKIEIRHHLDEQLSEVKL